MPTPWGISTGIRPAKNARKMTEEGKTREEIIKILESEYLIEESKANLACDVAAKEREMLKTLPENGVSLYVGIPFCPSRCAYCSFISQATEHNKKYIEPYVEALLKEIEYSAAIVKRLGQRVDTLYFGGGTPTAIAPNLLEKIIVKIKECFDLSDMREFTVEAGRPDTFTEEMTQMLVRREVDRISINPQTMNDETLKRVKRGHTADDVRRAFYMAREAGIRSINADLIAGLPGETEEDVENSAKEILELEPEAVTVHTLYMKRAAELIGEFERLRFADNVRAMTEAAEKKIRGAGMEPYYMYKQRNTLGNLENISYAKKGHESFYNVYIMEEVQPIVALGAGGSTKMVRGADIKRVFNPKDAVDYVKRIDEVLKRKDIYADYYEK
ncbi:MAG: coproporphyrinogen dehydrogenase HemZ [Clostridia bacterium]|nr:coproporphyrinogen dehydrogenase HemZ [Clostridia bacterium]